MCLSLSYALSTSFMMFIYNVNALEQNAPEENDKDKRKVLTMTWNELFVTAGIIPYRKWHISVHQIKNLSLTTFQNKKERIVAFKMQQGILFVYHHRDIYLKYMNFHATYIKSMKNHNICLMSHKPIHIDRL